MDIEKIERSVKFSRWGVLSIFVITLASYVGWFVLSQGQALSVKSGDWGAFGDFVGGLLNPLIAYSAFYWLTVSVVVQKSELAATKKALVDSSVSQEKQVKEAYRSSAIEVIKMQSKELSIRLESEYSFRNGVALNAATSGSIAQTMNMDGKIVSSNLEVASSNRLIATLQDKQFELIKEAQALLNDEEASIEKAS